ncbi:Glucose-1-phosphate adenylyltransferase [Quillaja saponaria]|uniref:Glucose-1-phosphate adenylyltransferase n=1 Tax=Quillaja saponaria TaxID=32244 RepID=A0AAD7QAD9_QUISA|nr:Glucose-1-phosphate adenylyltransferase [Quillaja saponaria]
MVTKDYNVQAYLFGGYWEDIGIIKSFFNANFALMDQLPKFQLYDQMEPLFTSPRFLPPINILSARECSVKHSIVGVRSRLEAGVELKEMYN